MSIDCVFIAFKDNLLLLSQDSSFIKSLLIALFKWVVSDSVEEMYKKAHAAIRADHTPKAPEPKQERKEGEKPKRFNSKKMTLAQKRARVAQKKAAFLKKMKRS